MGKTVFQTKWLTSYAWVQKHDDKHKAVCKWCNKTIDLGKMAEGALRSHEKSGNHKESSKTYLSMQHDAFVAFKKAPQSATSSVSSTDNTQSSLPCASGVSESSTSTRSNISSSNISDFVIKKDVLKSEILWTIHTIVTHSSYKSNENVGELFKVMFPDSKFAEKFQCGERKTAYLTVFGIAEYIRSEIMKEVQGYYSVLFDESLNKKAQTKQMDIHVRYWVKDQVVNRYLGSVFMGHGSANDLIHHFNEGINELKSNAKNMVQISMDGPNVNLKFFELMKTQIQKDFGVTLINIGTCGLHTMHNAFKLGCQSTEWGLSSLLSSLYYLFKDSPARREDYQKMTGSNIMPLKFVSHRWMENVPACERALDILDHVMVYIQRVQEKKVNKPSCKSYEDVLSKTRDPLIKAKLEFFRYVAVQLQPFLKNFQTDKPMVPFLVSDLSNIIQTLLQKAIKPDVINAAEGSKLFSLDLADKTSFLPPSKVDIGFSADKTLKTVVKDKKIKCSEKQVMEFQIECRTFILKLVGKLLEKCPATYSFVRNLSMLNPQEMVSNKKQCKAKFKRVLAYLVNCNRVVERECDEIIRQYECFLETQIPILGSEKFSGFKPYEDRLDEFLCSHLSSGQYEKLMDIIKICLVLSHGQAAVERGFSVNKEIVVENLQNQSLIAQRLICDYVNKVGGVLNVPITKELLQYAAASRRKYENYLDEQRTKKHSDEQSRKRKQVTDAIKELECQCKQARLDIESLKKSADEFAVKAENERNLSHIAKSNSLRETAKQKTKLCQQLEEKLELKKEELKQI